MSVMIGTKEIIRLHQFGKRFLTLSQKLSIGTATLTPINYIEEKSKFFTSDTYNPHFYYRKNNTAGLHKEIQSLLQELNTISLPDPLRFYLRNAIQALSTDIDLIDAIGTDSFAEVAADIFQYDSIDSRKLLEDTAAIKFNEPNNCTIRSAEEMAEYFQDFIDELNLDYRVTIDHFNDHIIRVSPKELIIGAKVRRFCNNVNRLVVHEIESHVFQRVAIKNANNPLLLIIPRPNISLWGEGLAVYNEIKSNTITRSAFETYYYRLKAVEMLNKSFRSIFNELTKYVKPEKAFMITYRVKRGMGNTYHPGGFGKDASYLMGYKKVCTYLENNGNIEFLYKTKFPELGEILQEYELLNESDILLPQYLQKKIATPTPISSFGNITDYPTHLRNSQT